MSVLLRCNLFSILYQSSRRGLSPNFTNKYLRRTIALNSELSDPNVGNVQQKSNVLHQYASMMQGDLHSGLLGTGDILKMKNVVFKSESLTSIKSLLFLKCCGTIAVDVKPEIRIKYLHNIWDFIKTSGIPLDISHYNAFLKAHIENEKPLDDEEFIKNMELNGITPNRVTYQHFLTYYCYTGELAKATRILEEMKEKNINLNENTFNALILGHAVANDINGAEDILEIMKDKGLAIDSTTYFMYVCGLACSGNLNKITEILEQCSSNNINFSTKKLLDIVYYLIINGHKDYALKMLTEINLPSNSKEGIVFQFRLLHKKEFDTLLDVLNLNPEDTKQLQKLRLAFRYLEKNEDLKTILEFKDVCSKKGIKTDLASSLIQNLRLRHDSNMNLKSIHDYYKAEGEVEFSLFMPFLNKYVGERNTKEVVQTIKTILSCKKKISHTFFTNNIVDKLKLDIDAVVPFIDSLYKAGLPNGFLVKAYVISILRNGDLKLLKRLVTSFNLPSNIESLKFDLVEAVNKGNAPVAAFYLKFWLCQTVYEETNKKYMESPREKDGVYNLQLYPEILEHFDDIVMEIFKSCETETLIEFLKELIKLEVPVSSEVVDLIKSSFKTEEIGELIDKLNTSSTLKMENMNDYKFFRNSRNNTNRDPEFEENERNFQALIDSGNLTEAEQMLKETQSLKCYDCYKILIQALDKAGEEQKIVDYLKQYWNVDGGNLSKYSSDSYLELETIKRRLFNEARSLIISRRLYSRQKFVADLIPILQEFSDEDLSELLVNRSKFGNVLNMEKFFSSLLIESDSDFLLRLCTIMYKSKIISLSYLTYDVIPNLYCTERLNIIENINEMVRNKSVSFLIAYCLCTGDTVRLCNVLDTGIKINFNAVRFVEGMVDEERRIGMIKEILSTGKGFHLNHKNILYEMLIEHYKEIGEEANKCMELWYDQQEENLEPTNLFLIHLADVCKKNNMSISFEIPTLLSGSFPKLDEYPPRFSRYMRRCINGLQNLDEEENQIRFLEFLVRSFLINSEDVRVLMNLIKDESGRLMKLLKRAMGLCKWQKAFYEDIDSYVKGMGIDTPNMFFKRTPLRFIASLYTKSPPPSENVATLLMWFYWSKLKPNPRCAEFIQSYVLEHKNQFLIKNPLSLRSVPVNIRQEFSQFLHEKIGLPGNINFKDADESFIGTTEYYEEATDLFHTPTGTDFENREEMNDTFQYSAHKSNNKEMEKNETPQSNIGP